MDDFSANDGTNNQNLTDPSDISEIKDGSYSETPEYQSRHDRKQAQRDLDSTGSSFFSFLKELPALIITAVIIAFLLKWLVIQPFYIPSESMEPTLEPGDRVLVSKFLYRFVKPQKNDVIVFLAPRGEGVDFIKRIVAVGGDEIRQKNGVVYVNDNKLEGDYKTTPGDTFTFPSMKIADKHVFVMGDNRTNSSDSRVFGPIPETSIVGKAFVLYWPPNRIRIFH